MNGTSWTQDVSIQSESNLDWQIGDVGDLDGDGNQDILWRNWTTGDNQVWLMNGTTWQQTVAFLAAANQDWQMVGTQRNVLHADLYGISFDVVESEDVRHRSGQGNGSCSA